MRVLVHSSAESDLDRIADWIAKDNPRAAARMVSKLYERISFLETDELAHMGRPGLVEGTRELVESPYIIVYRVDEERKELVVLSIVHGARKRTEG